MESLITFNFLISLILEHAFLFISTAVIKFNLNIFFKAIIFKPILGPNSIRLLILKNFATNFLTINYKKTLRCHCEWNVAIWSVFY